MYAYVPQGVTSIGLGAFEECTGIVNIVLPPSVQHISRKAFYECSSLRSINIPMGVSIICWGTFLGCRSLAAIEFPPSMKLIDYCAFSGCTSLRDLVVPDGLEAILGWAFKDCTNLRNISVPDSVEMVGEEAFAGTPWLANYPYNQVILGRSFYKCKGMFPDVIIPPGVVRISARAFLDCMNVEIVRIPEGVTKIGNDAFQNCRSINRTPRSLSFLIQFSASSVLRANRDSDLQITQSIRPFSQSSSILRNSLRLAIIVAEVPLSA